MPTVEELRDAVLREVSRASGTPRRHLADGLKLRGDLMISHENFVVLAQKLRALIKNSNPDGTLLLREIDTASSTVGSVVNLVGGRQ